MKKLLPFVLLLMWPACAFASPAEAAPSRKLVVFYSATCSKCLIVNHEVMPDIEERFKGSLTFEYRDISDVENYKMLLGLKEQYGVEAEDTLPVFFLDGYFLITGGGYREKLISFISEALKKGPAPARMAPAVDLVSRFNAFRPAAVVSAGLVDGINPCAFTVIVFFVSFLALQKYRRREIAAVGFAFIFAVFLTYILVGLGLFGFLYRLRGFWIFSRLFNLGIGLLSLFLGVAALYDFFKFIRTKQTEGLILQLPQKLKSRVHAIIGRFYRNKSGRNLAGLLLSALLCGFLVSIIEAVCTGQVYLPTLVFILKTTSLKAQAAFYIALYNVMFVVPLIIIFLAALLGVTSGQFSAFLTRRLAAIKLMMALLFLVLGVAVLYSEAPKRAVEEPGFDLSREWDFGKIEEGRVVSHTFVLRNDSAKTLRIKQIASSCGCTVSKVRRKRLRPGEATGIEVSFNSKGYSGPVRQFIYVHTDSLDNEVVRFIIKAEVFKSIE